MIINTFLVGVFTVPLLMCVCACARTCIHMCISTVLVRTACCCMKVTIPRLCAEITDCIRACQWLTCTLCNICTVTESPSDGPAGTYPSVEETRD